MTTTMIMGDMMIIYGVESSAGDASFDSYVIPRNEIRLYVAQM